MKRIRCTRSISFGALILPLLWCSACDQSAPPAAAAASVRAVDPRFESAQSLLDTFNDVALSADESTDPRVVLDLFNAENDLQRRMLAVARAAIPAMEYGSVLRITFPFDRAAYAGREFDIRPRDTARLTEPGAERAKATFKGADGHPRELHLVRLEGRWWISGYTLEYDTRLDEYRPLLDPLERYFRAIGPVLTRFAPRVARGECSTAKEAGLDAMIEIDRHFREHGDEWDNDFVEVERILGLRR